MTARVRSLRQGIGSYDARVLDAAGAGREAHIAAELRRLERARSALLIDSIGPVTNKDRVLSVGRSVDTVSTLEERFGCVVDEDNESWWRASPDGLFDVVVDDDTHLRGDLFAYCAKLGRLVRPRGRYAFTAWCINDQLCGDAQHIRRLNTRVGIAAQPRARYFAALVSNGFVPYVVADLTRQAIPYWRLRLQSSHQTGVEQAFLAAYLSRTACLLLVAAERCSEPRRPPPRPRGRREPSAPAPVQPQPTDESPSLTWD